MVIQRRARQIGDSGWDYEAVYSRSRLRTAPAARCCWPVSTNTCLARSWAQWRRGLCGSARLFQPLSPNEYQSPSGYQESRNAAWLQTFSASVNGRLFALPGGDAALAAVVEAGSQGYRNRPDPRLGTGEFWNTSAGVGAGGERDRYAAGVELQLPLLQSLTTTLAGRYDQYRAGGEHIGKAT